ncbi:hypothetical protein K470DRAFT_296573 [Piedraia hortae CBS 480.64]|uniref:Uncharacterized protein n=1 Tax=Piedraia hortae CBS 480.64 TaxID=1314780 RepID=A0A6A7BUI6_9PEZI|nr:hypothetical protein K470DRAFT_296573 [Piedraia hortae CBS 480.64]
MSEPGTSPPRLHRTLTLREPAQSSEDSVTSRGKTLPGLIALRSNSTSGIPRHRQSPGKSNSVDSTTGREGERAHHVDPPQIRHDENWDDRFRSPAASILNTPEMRSQRLIGNSNPRYRWEQYWKSDEQLKKMKKPIREYYTRVNSLIQHYLYIDSLLDSSLPHNLIQEYQHTGVNSLSGQANIPATITEEPTSSLSPLDGQSENSNGDNGSTPRVKRTPNNIYRHKDGNTDESTPLLKKPANGGDVEQQIMPPELNVDDDSSGSRIVNLAIAINFTANVILLILKAVVAALTSSVSVYASLVDAALDFLSTAIIGLSTFLMSRIDKYAYPVGRRRLEPVGVLIFSVVMITAFVQVALDGIQKLLGDDHTVVKLTIPSIAIMGSTVVIKFFCWLWCRLVKNSSVQALAQDAMTDIVFNIFSIIFPLIGSFAHIWWLDPLGGVLLSFYVIINWARTSSEHIRNLTGRAASADERNVLLYLTMRFAKTIKQIQGLQAYHSGDKLIVEVDLVLDEQTSLRDSHDLGESLQYVLESVPNVDRAFVHLDYASYNLPSHMQQDSQ